jgi:hypothetical protein
MLLEATPGSACARAQVHPAQLDSTWLCSLRLTYHTRIARVSQVLVPGLRPEGEVADVGVRSELLAVQTDPARSFLVVDPGGFFLFTIMTILIRAHDDIIDFLELFFGIVPSRNFYGLYCNIPLVAIQYSLLVV